MQTYKRAVINCIPYTCQSIAGEDITIGALIGYDENMNIVNNGPGVVTISKAKYTVRKGQWIEYVIDCTKIPYR